MLEWLNFPGGLSQNDWFTLFTGTISTAFGVTSYNQAAYCSNVGWRQAQLYQEKNYRLAWVAIARDDIREMMSISVNRIDNYNLVATLVLAVAVEGFLSVEFSQTCPAFIVNGFRVSMAVSIMFLAMAIMFGIRGQNSAFMNTMRLLTWEVRPENPQAHTHDYMKQAQQFERDGARKLFRMPGIMSGYHDWEAASKDVRRSELSQQRNGEARSSKEAQHEDPALEALVPKTRDLIYLNRFAHFMQLWVPYDLGSRYCMGLGLISLSHGAAYFSLGRISRDNELYTGLVACPTIALFVFITILILSISSSNSRVSSLVIRMAIILLFMWGPVSGCVAALTPAETNMRWFFSSMCPVGHVVMYGAIFLSSFVEMEPPTQVTQKFTTGPHGQHFPETRELEIVESSPNLPPPTAMGHREPTCVSLDDILPEIRHEDSGGFPSIKEEKEERVRALEVQGVVARTLRGSLLLTDLLWICILMAEVLAGYNALDATLADVLMEEVPLFWPGNSFRPHALACAQNDVFIANKYEVARMPASGGVVFPVACNVTGIIKDVLAFCNGDGGCRPFVLQSDEAYAHLVDCETGAHLPLRREPAPVLRVSFLRQPKRLQSLETDALLVLHRQTLVEYHFSINLAEWNPRWEVVDVEADVDSIDVLDDRLFVFRREANSDSGTLDEVSLLSAARVRRLRLPLKSGALAGGCVTDTNAVIVLPSGRTPNLFRGQLPQL